VPGIGPKTAARLAALGLRTLAAVGEAPEALLAERFGPKHGRELARRARFESDGQVGAPHKSVSESRERTFERDLSDPRELRDALARMAAELCESLTSRGRRGRTIGIKVRLDDFTTVTRARSLPEPTSDARVVSEVALRLLCEYDPSRPVRLLGVRVANLAAGSAHAAGPPADQVPSRPRAPGDQLTLPGWAQ
jgi:DNA polymerase-4